jgi:hypothetical protein
MATKEVMASDAQAVWEIDRQLFSLQRLEVMDKIRDPHIDQRLVVAVHGSNRSPDRHIAAAMRRRFYAIAKHVRNIISRKFSVVTLRQWVKSGGVDFRSTVAGPAPFASFPWPAAQ